MPLVYGENVQKIFEVSPINGLELALQKKGQMPISNQLRLKEIFERDRYVSGWSHIYHHSTNPVKAQVDTINAHGGNAGYHPMVCAIHLAALLEKKSIAKDIYGAIGEADKKVIQSVAMKSAIRRPISPASSRLRNEAPCFFWDLGSLKNMMPGRA